MGDDERLCAPTNGSAAFHMMMTVIEEVIVIGQSSMTSALFCSAASGIDQSRDNHVNLLPPPGLMGNDVSFF